MYQLQRDQSMQRQPPKLTVQWSPCWSPGNMGVKEAFHRRKHLPFETDAMETIKCGMDGERRCLCSQIIILSGIFVCVWFWWCYLCYKSMMAIKAFYFKTINWIFFSLPNHPKITMHNFVEFFHVILASWCFHGKTVRKVAE